jgi:hypothetical protein
MGAITYVTHMIVALPLGLELRTDGNDLDRHACPTAIILLLTLLMTLASAKSAKDG